jgi:hypothetical protein
MSSVVISGDTSGTVSVTVPAVAGTNTVTIPASTGTVMVSGNMPAFAATASATQSLATSTYTKVAFNTKTFDTNTNYDTTLYRFTPTVAGYYQVQANIAIGAGIANYGFAQIYKNGSNAISGNYFSLTPGGTNHTVGGLLYLNGSTDYIEAYMYQNSGSGITGCGGPNSQFQFSACLVRSA